MMQPVMNRFLFLTLFALITIPASAVPPKVNARLAPEYSGAGEPVWGQTEYIAAAGEYIPTGVAPVDTSSDGESAAPHLFLYGTIVMLTCDVDALGFFVHDTAVTTATTGAVTDSGSTAGRTTGANGFWIEAGVTRHVVVPTPPSGGNQIATNESQVSVRTKSCGATAGSTTADAVYGRPCDSTNDCFHVWAATCAASNGQPKGSYLKIHPTAAAQCSIEIEH